MRLDREASFHTHRPLEEDIPDTVHDTVVDGGDDVAVVVVVAPTHSSLNLIYYNTCLFVSCLLGFTTISCLVGKYKKDCQSNLENIAK